MHFLLLPLQFSDCRISSSITRSTFCLNPAGDTPSSARLFDAIVSGCIPVIVSDELELPFEGILDYRKVTQCINVTFFVVFTLKQNW